MGFDTSLTNIKPEEIYDLDKSGESTETLDTAEMSESSEDHFDEYKEMVDRFNDRMLPGSDQQNDGNNRSLDEKNTDSTRLQSSLPPDIARYKAEIWYPECRDCACCQGFKYGCTCAPLNYGICMCVTGVPDDFPTATMFPQDFCYQNSYCTIPPPPESQTFPIERRGSKRNIYTDNRQRKGNAPCRFFFSAAGCRHGDKCSFSHTK